MHHVVALACHRLGNLALMVWEYEVHTSSVDVEVVAEVFASHGRAFAVPSRESIAPRTRPTHDMLRLCFFPEREVRLVVLLIHSRKVA